MANSNAPSGTPPEPLAVPSIHSAEEAASFARKVLERVGEAARDLRTGDAGEIAGMAADRHLDAGKLEALAWRLAAAGLPELSESAMIAAALLDLQDPQFKQIWGGAFNGQMRRRAIIGELLAALDFAAILETGTFRGSSTEYMAERFALPIYTCETNQRCYQYSRLRLADKPNVRIALADSRAFLKTVLESGELPDGPLFCYLDAHWEDDLPVWEEIDLVFAARPSSVAVIDDFRVPGDRGFRYDDYGPGKCLSVIDLRANVAAEVDLLFPRRSSAAETGARRGMAVLAQRETADRILARVPDLERIEWRQAVSMDAMVGELPNVTAAVSAVRSLVESQAETTRGALSALGETLLSKVSELLETAERQRETARLESAALRDASQFVQEDETEAAADGDGASRRKLQQLRQIAGQLRADALASQLLARQQAMEISEHKAALGVKDRELNEGQRLLSSLGRDLAALDRDHAARLAQIQTLTARLEECEADRAARLEHIVTLTARLEESEADRAARLNHILTLTAQLADSDADRAARLEHILTLTALVKEKEAERDGRTEQNDRLTARLEASEAESAARSERIDALTARLEAAETESAARAQRIDALTAQLKAVEAESAARAQQIEILTRRPTLGEKMKYLVR